MSSPGIALPKFFPAAEVFGGEKKKNKTEQNGSGPRIGDFKKKKKNQQKKENSTNSTSRN